MGLRESEDVAVAVTDAELRLAILHRLQRPDDLDLVPESLEEVPHAFHMEVQGAGELGFVTKMGAGREKEVGRPGLKHAVFAAPVVRGSPADHEAQNAGVESDGTFHVGDVQDPDDIVGVRHILRRASDTCEDAATDRLKTYPTSMPGCA